MNDRGLPILMYHSLDESRSVISTDPHGSRRRLARLREAGIAIDLDDWIASGRPAIENAFAITFDDGYQNVLFAAEILHRFGWPATVFLVSDFIAGENSWEYGSKSIPRLPLLSWNELDLSRSAGFRFGAHSRTHRRLNRLDESSLDDEMRGSRDAISRRPASLVACSPIRSDAFRISATNRGCDLRRRVRDAPEALRRNRFLCGYSSDRCVLYQLD